jgi:signal transduction histidine kinase
MTVRDDGTIEALLIQAHEAERVRLARRLHDDFGQRAAALTIDLDLLLKALPASDVRHKLQALSDRSLTLAKDLQVVSHGLYPPRLRYLGIVSASASLCSDMSKQSNVDVAFSDEATPEGLSAWVSLLLYRILQEAIANAVQHAGSAEVRVTLRGTPGHVDLEVSDSGVGFDTETVLSGRAPGLIGMLERARLMGGQVLIQSRPAGGTSICAHVPVAASLNDPSFA